jgi:hypothetical protein
MSKEPIASVVTTKGTYYFYECDEPECNKLAYYSVIGEWKDTTETVLLRLCRNHYKEYLDLLDNPLITEIITPSLLDILRMQFPNLWKRII